MRSIRFVPILAASALLAACASAPQAPAVHPQVIAVPNDFQSEPTASAPPASAPAAVKPVAPAQPAPIAYTNYTNPQAGRALLDRLLPKGIPARKAWFDNVFASFTQLRIPYSPQYFCAVLAVAEQESSYNPDPVVPNLSAIVWKQIDDHRRKYMIPSFVIDAAMMKRSPDGRTYKERVNALRTKREMNKLYEDMARELPYGQDMALQKNPIRDGGPMQVSVAFAQTQIRAWPYPYSYSDLRDEVFSLRGSVYFGTAILLQYAAPYDKMIYRFADYNAGRYSSRNAAFQAAVARISGQKLALDGDLMLYSNKMDRIFSGATSDTQRALSTMTGRLQMSPAEIVRDLKQEKLSTFEQTPLFQRVFAMADRQAGHRVPREQIPQIVLVSPKFTHKLSTEWFANKVNGHYRACLARGGFSGD
jgi:hypothetical protein